MKRESFPAFLGIAVVVLAAATLLLRLPTALSELNAKRQQNDAYSAHGRMLAAADSLNIDNTFVTVAIDSLPPDATYAVALPSRQAVADGRLAEITYDAVTPYMRVLLLPRRAVALGSASYVLCYACGRKIAGVTWQWTGTGGLKIGRRTAG